jgi:hypothetical protein
MSNYKFSIDKSGLTVYVDENKTELLYQLQMASDISNYASVEVGVKGTRRLRFMSNSITLQSDSCAFNASGTTTLTEKDVTVADLSVMESLCVQDLDRIWAEQLVRQGAEGYEVLPEDISRAYIEKRLNALKKVLNVADWQGDTGSGVANTNKYDGLIKEIFNDGSVVDGNTSDASTATSKSNILARMQEMYLAIPDDLFGDAPDGGNLVWFVPTDYYRFYIEALKDANLFHFQGGEGQPESTRYYGTNIEIVPQIGLAGQNKMVLTTKDNIVVAMDGDMDDDEIKIWYSEDDRIHKTLIRFKRGITYKFSDYIVKWGLGTS